MYSLSFFIAQHSHETEDASASQLNKWQKIEIAEGEALLLYNLLFC